MKKLNNKGFTIVELVIVIAVIAILAAILVPTFADLISNTKDTAVISDAQSAYKKYYAGLEVDGLASAAGDFVYGENGRFVVIKDGQVIDTVYADQNAALSAQFPEDTSADIDPEAEGIQYMNYEVSDTAVDGIDNLYIVTSTKATVNG